MHTPLPGTDNFSPRRNKQHQAAHRGHGRLETIPAKASLRQVRDQNYGAVVLSRSKHERNVVALYDGIRKESEHLLKKDAHDIPRRISERIAALVEEADLDLSAYQARGAGSGEYGKFLLFSSLSMDNVLLRETPFCVQLFCFETGQATPIHNHPCECASLVLEGEIRERHYVASCPGRASKISSRLRRAGHRSELDVERNNHPHSLKNNRAGRSITAHVYTIDGISLDQTCAIRDLFVLA